MNADAVRAAIEGTVVPAVPVPFDRNGRFQRDWQHRYVDWMAGQAVGAVAVWAHTGRGLLLDEDVRGEVLEHWVGAERERLVVCGVGAAEGGPGANRLPTDPRARTDAVMEGAVRMAESARSGGAAALLVHPPTPLRGLSDLDTRVVAYHEAIAAVGLPIIAFLLYEAAGGITYSRAVLEPVLSAEWAVGIKLATLDSVITFQDVVRIVEEIPDALVITGEDRFLGYSLMLGARCALVGMAAALTDVSVELMQARDEDRPRDFMRVSAALDRFAAATFVAPMEGYVQRMGWALADDGVLPDDPFDPFGPTLAPAERGRVRDAVRALRAS